MSRREWIARSRSLLVAVVLLTVPLATDTMSDQDQTVQGASAAGAPVPLPPELARYGETRSKPFLSSYRLPDTITFADSTVPLNVWQVRERIEYEFYRLLEDEGESIILAKRTGRCFPPAERQLAEAGLPDDLKFILLVESKCISAAYSRAKASGPWQFVPSTGRLFSLQNNHWKDDRRNLELSTEAAVKYLKKLHDIFGDWFLAMAAYNTGEVHIRKAMREQRVDDLVRAFRHGAALGPPDDVAAPDAVGVRAVEDGRLSPALDDVVREDGVRRAQPLVARAE